jgi:hypothetical protein
VTRSPSDFEVALVVVPTTQALLARGQRGNDESFTRERAHEESVKLLLAFLFRPSAP